MRSNRRRGRGENKAHNLPPIPNEEGRKLMDAGAFGTGRHYPETLRPKRLRLADSLVYRELGLSKYAPVGGVGSVAQVSVPDQMDS